MTNGETTLVLQNLNQTISLLDQNCCFSGVYIVIRANKRGRKGRQFTSRQSISQIVWIFVLGGTKKPIHVFYYMAELVHGEKEHSDWFPERCVFCYTDQAIRCTIQKLIS